MSGYHSRAIYSIDWSRDSEQELLVTGGGNQQILLKIPMFEKIRRPFHKNFWSTRSLPSRLLVISSWLLDIKDEFENNYLLILGDDTIRVWREETSDGCNQNQSK